MLMNMPPTSIDVILQAKDNPAHKPLSSNRRLIGKTVVLCKKIVRRLLLWYLDPLANQQSSFNNATTETVISINRITEAMATQFACLQMQIAAQSDKTIELEAYVANHADRLNQLEARGCKISRLEEKYSWLQDVLFNQSNYISDGKLDVCRMLHAKKPYLAVVDSSLKDSIADSMRTPHRIPLSFPNTAVVSILPQTGTCLDIGANVGVVSLFFAANGWQCYAFEASSRNAALLRKSIMLNSFQNIKLFEVAISDHSGELTLAANGPQGFVVVDGYAEELNTYERVEETFERIACRALDDMLDDELADLDAIDFIKIDVEGSEVAVLRGMSNLINSYKHPAIYIEINAWTLFLQGETPFSLLKTASELGYKAYVVEEMNVLSLYPEGMFPMEVLFDVILLKDIPVNMIVRSMDWPEDEAVLEWLKKKFERYHSRRNQHLFNNGYSWDDYIDYLYYMLKDYPQYYNTPAIRQLLKTVASSDNNNVLTERAIAWFRAMNKGGLSV